MSTNDASICRNDETNDRSLSSSEQESDVAHSVAAIPASPLSVTISNDDDSARSSVFLSMAPGKTDNADCTIATYRKSYRKSVRFSDINQVLIDRDFSEKVHQYRTDVWYTVRFMNFVIWFILWWAHLPSYNEFRVLMDILICKSFSFFVA